MSISTTNITANVPRFSALIDTWKAKQPPVKSFDRPLEEITPGCDRSNKDVIVALRTRPPIPSEKARFVVEDTITSEDGEEQERKIDFCVGVEVRSAEPGKMVAHVPAAKWNGPTLTQKSFEADLAFGPQISNEEVYKRTVEAHSMIDLVLGGGVGCVLAYGQTGSGKTHTMEAIEKFIARDLFAAAEQTAQKLRELKGLPAENTENPFEFRVSFLELIGKNASDLVHGEVDKPKKVEVTETKGGSVRPDLEEVIVKTSEELQGLITESLSHRRVSATARNPRSSRSHAILTIWIKNIWVPFADEGQLILVDLAGSERYDDSKEHDRARMEESRENNVSLSNLKDCVRARAKAVNDDEAFVHIPYRSNRLTLMLKPIFDLENAQLSKTIVIAHVSPHLQDSAHSVNTLSYASPFKVAIPPPKKAKVYDEKDPRTWNNKELVKWFVGELSVLGRRDAKKDKGSKGDEKETENRTQTPPTIHLSIDPRKMFPEPMTGKQATRLFCGEWLALCLQSTTFNTPLSKEEEAIVTNHALDTYSSFGYLWATARMRTRKAVLKNRNQGEDENYWGDEPIPPTNQRPHLGLSRAELMQYDRKYSHTYQAELQQVMADAKARGEDPVAAQIVLEKTRALEFKAKVDSGEEEIPEGVRQSARYYEDKEGK